MTQSNLRLFTFILFLALSGAPAPGQIRIDTVAGGVIRSGVSAQQVALGLIAGVTQDSAGNLVFCDSSNHVIRRINADGTIQTIAGQGIPGYGGDGGPATSALLSYPSWPHYDSAGNLYFADANNFRIRRIDAKGIITTVAGTGIRPSTCNSGTCGALGNNGPAPQAQIDFVTDLAVATNGSIYFIDDLQLRRVTPSGEVEFVPNCSGCAPYQVYAVAADSKGNMYVSREQHVYLLTTDDMLQNFAGFGSPTAANYGNGGPAIQAPPSDFVRLTTDGAGNVYTEEGNPSTIAAYQQYVIRRIGTDGNINIIAGTLTGGSDADGPALQTIIHPGYGEGLAVDKNGLVTFADAYRLRQVTTKSTVATMAGGQPTPAPDGTVARSAWFVGPIAIALDHAGQLYVGQSCIIQKVNAQGVLSTIAGTGVCSNTPPKGPALTTQLNGVFSIAVDSLDQVFFSDSSGGIYVVDTNGTISEVTEVAPNGNFPKLAIDSKDRLYFAAEFGPFGRISPASAAQTIYSFPQAMVRGMAVDAADNVYLCCDRTGSLQRYTSDLQLSTVPDQAAPSPSLITGYALAVDGSSNIWQTSQFNGLTKGASPFGDGCCNYGDGGSAESAYITPSALAFAPNGDLYFLDSNTSRVRKITGRPPAVTPTISAGGIVNAASLTGGTIAPGELISIFGSNFGPPGLDVSAPQNNVVPKALNNVHVYFGGLGNFGAITARTNSQINVFVPYNIANATSIQITVDVDGVLSDPVTVPVAPSAFGLSTADASGSGQGAILNQDNSYNSHSHPATRGSVVTLFGTGEGVTTPALPDGSLVISTPYSTTTDPVTVTIGDQTAQVTYDGAAPYLPTGVFQIDVRIPDNATSGDVPIKVSIGGISTTRTVTCAVE
ncbi:MAG TPA: hypothetical protein VMH80_07630 [Bryobacteraceae bacterium]|nr:hypothetical protein [Bryobacteraceae bacterium]